MAAAAGAAAVTGVDSSASAVQLAQDNAELNGLTDRCATARGGGGVSNWEEARVEKSQGGILCQHHQWEGIYRGVDLWASAVQLAQDNARPNGLTVVSPCCVSRCLAVCHSVPQVCICA
jgi:23S rRNA G2069 N7-methylase RlmK/C1962 C5-methylase RlmI